MTQGNFMDQPYQTGVNEDIFAGKHAITAIHTAMEATASARATTQLLVTALGSDRSATIKIRQVESMRNDLKEIIIALDGMTDVIRDVLEK